MELTHTEKEEKVMESNNGIPNLNVFAQHSHNSFLFSFFLLQHKPHGYYNVICIGYQTFAENILY